MGFCVHPQCGGQRAVVRFKVTTPVCMRHWRSRRHLAQVVASVANHPEVEVRTRHAGGHHIFIATIGQPDADDLDELDIWARDFAEAQAKAEAELAMYDAGCIVQKIRQTAF
jgi:hypothetical protein